MIRFDYQYSVDAPVESVFEYISNPHNDEQWQAACRRARLRERKPVAPGSEFDTQVGFLGRNLYFLVRVFEHDRDYRYGYETIAGPLYYRGVYLFTPTDANTTQVDWHFEAEPGTFFGIIPRPLIRKVLAKQIASDIERLKRIFADADLADSCELPVGGSLLANDRY